MLLQQLLTAAGTPAALSGQTTGSGAAEHATAAATASSATAAGSSAKFEEQEGALFAAGRVRSAVCALQCVCVTTMCAAHVTPCTMQRALHTTLPHTPYALGGGAYTVFSHILIYRTSELQSRINNVYCPLRGLAREPFK